MYTLAFLGGIGVQEILLIGLFVLVFFGARKIPEFMKGMGKGIREFKTGMNDITKDVDPSAEPTPKLATKQEEPQ